MKQQRYSKSYKTNPKESTKSQCLMNHSCGVTLTDESNTVEWEVLSIDEDFPRGQKLIIRQILLGAEAKEYKFNVVEVHTVKHNLRIPIPVFLNAGETRAINPKIHCCETSATKLFKGNGAVYIHGQNVKDEVKVVDIEDCETNEEDDSEEEEDEAQAKKKQKLENNADVKNSKNKKK